MGVQSISKDMAGNLITILVFHWYIVKCFIFAWSHFRGRATQVWHVVTLRPDKEQLLFSFKILLIFSCCCPFPFLRFPLSCSVSNIFLGLVYEEWPLSIQPEDMNQSEFNRILNSGPLCKVNSYTFPSSSVGYFVANFTVVPSEKSRVMKTFTEFEGRILDKSSMLKP